MTVTIIKGDAPLVADVSVADPDKPYDAMDDFAKSLDVGYRHISAIAWPTADRADSWVNLSKSGVGLDNVT